MPQDKKLLISESHGYSNRCTSCRINLIYKTRNRSWQAVRDNLSHWQLFAPVLIHNTSAARSVGTHLVSLPQTTIEALEKAKHLLMKRLHWFTRLISPACDQNVQYVLAGTNPLVLNQHRCWLSTSLSLPSQLMVLLLPLRAPSSLKLTFSV
jgi:hypothetical protein